MKRKVLVAGMAQSGSTALFNIVRQCYMQCGVRVGSFGGMRALDIPPDATGPVVLKDHNCSKEFVRWADCVFATKRDLRDCLASRRRRSDTWHGEKGVIACALKQIALFERAMQHADYIFCYERYQTDQVAEIGRIAAALELELRDPAAVLSSIERLASGDLRNDRRVTLFDDTMVTDGGRVGGFRAALSKDELEALERYFGWWLAKEGYELKDCSVSSKTSPVDLVLGLEKVFFLTRPFVEEWDKDWLGFCEKQQRFDRVRTEFAARQRR